MEKIKFAQYWGAACGGCDVSVLDLDVGILDVAEIADIVFWPIAVDGKLKDIEALPDKSITVTLYNGAVRNSENEHVAKLLRQKSVVMVAYGSCACFGGYPGLANLSNTADIKDYVYNKIPSNVNDGTVPQVETQVPEGIIEIPVLFDTVKALDQVVDVDYYAPGCPPTRNRIEELFGYVTDFVVDGKPLPPKGAVIAAEKTLCDECPRVKEFKRIEKIYHPHEVDIDPKKCLLDQGILCLGPATRAGCGAPCTQANQPCRGCFGPTSAVLEQGGSLISAIASLFKIDDTSDHLKTDDQVLEVVSQIRDPLGYFYGFTLAKSVVNHAVKERRD